MYIVNFAMNHIDLLLLRGLHVVSVGTEDLPVSFLVFHTFSCITRRSWASIPPKTIFAFKSDIW